MSNTPERIPLSAPLIKGIADYLMERPYREVAPLITALSNEVDEHQKTNNENQTETNQS